MFYFILKNFQFKSGWKYFQTLEWIEQLIFFIMKLINNYLKDKMMKSRMINSNLMKFKQKGAGLSWLSNQDHQLRYSDLRDGKQLASNLNINIAVIIYLRSHNKSSIKMLTSPKASIVQIKTLVEQKLKIQIGKQILFVNGKNVTENWFIMIQAGTIIHVLNSNIFCTQSDQISVKLHVMNFLVQNNQSYKAKYTVAADEMVGQFLSKVKRQVKSVYQNTDNDWQYYLLQSSRILQLEKPFFEQYIAKTVQIICIINDNPLKTKYTNDCEIATNLTESIIKENKQCQNEVNLKTVERSKQSDIQLHQIKINRNLTGENPLFSSSMPNFKKKLSRNDGQLNEPSRPLAKKIKVLKPRYQIEQISQIEPNQNYKFESPRRKECQQNQKKMQIHKLSPVIPKLMPINERRAIKMQIEKLFNQSQFAKTSYQDEVNSKEPLHEMPFNLKQKIDDITKNNLEPPLNNSNL